MPRKFDRSLIPPAPDLHFERELWRAGVAPLAGVDEAGRGALAGPVAAGAVVLPDQPGLGKLLHGVRDSKQMTAKARRHWAGVIREVSLSCHVGFASPQEIDELGIVPATRLAAMRALARLDPSPQHLLIDALSLPSAGLPETSLIKGDARSLSIACASVLAKVERDARLVEMESSYPGYRFGQNKGYGTQFHRQALQTLGPTPIHRYSYAPLRAE